MKSAKKYSWVIIASIAALVTITIVASCIPGGAPPRPTSTTSMTGGAEATMTHVPSRLPSNTPLRSTPTPSLPAAEKRSTLTPASEIISQPAENGISPEEAARLIPLHPSQVTVEIAVGTVLVKWQGTGENVGQYLVYRQTPNDEDWQQVGTVGPLAENIGLHEWEDTMAKPGTAYIYGISAVNLYGTESIISKSAVIVLP